MNNLPPDRITRPLATILRRVRRLQWARGLLAVATIALAALLATMAADYFLAPLPAAAHHDESGARSRAPDFSAPHLMQSRQNRFLP